MSDIKPSILFISSLNPDIGPGAIALDYVKALHLDGYKVDFLTKFKVNGHPEIDYILDKKEGILNNFIYKLWCKYGNLQINTHSLFYLKESQPPFPIRKVLKVIKKDYDIILVFFWQKLLSYRTIEAVYDKMKKSPKVVFICPDYSVMTGGCHFMGDCTNYKSGCGNCPMLGNHSQPKDFTAWNMNDRKRINAKIKPIVLANTYMLSFMKESPAMQTGAQLHKMTLILDLNKFKPLDDIREKYNIGKDKFIIFFACQNLTSERKGMSYMIDALNLLRNRLNNSDASKILIITAGKNNSDIVNNIHFEQKHFGFVDINLLPELYSLANVFLSTSIDDAGPSMVNQSLACGTPVISFEMGTALDVVKDQVTGFCVPLKDTKTFADRIIQLFNMDIPEYSMMRAKCREIAEKYHSYEYFLEVFNRAVLET